MSFLIEEETGKEILVSGNEAIVRGALEAGVRFAAAYPGSPSSEILGLLGRLASDVGVYAEWSVNEKVAMEAAAAAAMAGLRSLTAMKQNGLNVASDFLLNVNLTGVTAGFVVVVCDDPGAISSGNEQDPRWFARMGQIPLFEPSGHQELKEMVKWAFEISELIGGPVLIRSSTRTSHAQGNIKLGELPGLTNGSLEWRRSFVTMPVGSSHRKLLDKLREVRELVEKYSFDRYEGPDSPELIVVTCGTGYLYADEAVELLGLRDRVGIYKVATTNPIPLKLSTEVFKKTNRFLVIEEVDPFLEEGVKSLAAELSSKIGVKEFYGKATGHIPSVGELNTDIVIEALKGLLDVEYSPRSQDYVGRVEKYVADFVPARDVTFCPGCPHRATFWALQKAKLMDGRNAVICGDIGCYSLGVLPAGYQTLQTLHCMGSGAGLANGLGKLGQFGFDTPVLAVTGDSTFYHSVIPALVNAVHNEANFILIILDNGVTAMTGAQPHPGSNTNAMEQEAPVVDMVKVCEAVGAPVKVTDPFNLGDTTRIVYEMMQIPKGVRVIVARQACALYKQKGMEFTRYKMHVDLDKCIGKECGCDVFCVRNFKCPGLVFNKKLGKVQIDEALCSGCGVCAQICSRGAIIRGVG